MTALRLPLVYTVPPGVSFARALATQLWREYQHDLLALSDVQIYLPNRRSTRELADMFLEVSDGQATLLPRLTPLGDIDEEDLLESDPFILEEDPFLRPAIPSLERQLLLSRLILQRQDIRLSPGEAFRLAGDLGRFIDRSHTEQVDLEQLRDLVTGDLAAHWEKTKDFLSIITLNWPLILAQRNQLDPAERRNLIFEKKIEALRKNPPLHRVIAAGSTGSIPATARLLDMIARLPNGCVVLPGIDVTLEDKIWDAIDEVHPYYYQKRLIGVMAIDRGSIRPWPGSENAGAAGAVNEKLRLAHYAMQPQEIFDLSEAAIDAAQLTGMDFIAAENPLHEAKIIALRLREVLNYPEQTAVVVTPDRLLAEFIQQEMLRWDIAVNDSGGRALGDTVIGLFLKLIAGVCCTQCPATHILSILRHTLFRLHPPLERRAKDIHALETVLRANFLPAGGLREFSLHYQSPLLQETLAILEPFSDGCVVRPLHEWVEAHILCAEALASTAAIPGAEILWKYEDGEAAAQLLYKLRDAALNNTLELTAPDYTNFIGAALSQVVVRPNFGVHPRLRILSPIEARLQDANIIILAGLNEGVWPAPVKADTWLSRPMQKDMGFGSPDRRLGQSALDFLLLFSMKTVFMTWSKKREGVISHPSRWLQQIFAVLEKNHALNPDISDYSHWARQWDEPDRLAPQPAPFYSPPLHVRPRKLPVTAIGTWRQDPYTLYARQILKLYPLESLDRQPDPRDWGNAAHKILEIFFGEGGFEQPDPRHYFDGIGRNILKTYPLTPSQAKAWRGKLDAIRDWVLAHENRTASEVFPEKKLSMSFTLADGSSFELYGKSDRIDLEQAHLVVTDYKTGSLPTDASIKKGLSPQMPLLGLLAQNAKGLRHQETSLRYIKLNGKIANPVDVKDLKNPAELITLNHDFLIGLLDQYYIQEIPYTATTAANDAHDSYRHLKRVAEWASLDDEIDDDAEATA